MSDSPLDKRREEFLQSISDGLTDELACDLFRIDHLELTHRLAWDAELEVDMKQARARGILMVLREMLQTTTGQNYWLQRVPRSFDYMLDKDRASRVDADVFNDGATIQFLDKVQSQIYDESLE